MIQIDFLKAIQLGFTGDITLTNCNIRNCGPNFIEVSEVEFIVMYPKISLWMLTDLAIPASSQMLEIVAAFFLILTITYHLPYRTLCLPTHR
jgi:hypothetical protein